MSMGLKIWNASGTVRLDTSTDLVPTLYSSGSFNLYGGSGNGGWDQPAIYFDVLCSTDGKFVETNVHAVTYYTPSDHYYYSGLQFLKLTDRFRFYASDGVVIYANYRIWQT